MRVRDPPEAPPPVRDDESPLEKELELDWNLEKEPPVFSTIGPDSSFTILKNPLDLSSSELDGLEEVWKVKPEEYRPDPDSSELPNLDAFPDPKN